MNEGSVFSLVLVLVVGKYLSVACLRRAGWGGGGGGGGGGKCVEE